LAGTRFLAKGTVKSRGLVGAERRSIIRIERIFLSEEFDRDIENNGQSFMVKYYGGIFLGYLTIYTFSKY
jgi:hypothetical protein